MITVAVIGLLAGIAIPNFLKARTQSQTTACINNLRQIDAAKEQLAMEANLVTGASVVAASVHVYLKGESIPPVCPASGVYTYNVIGSNPVCNISGHAYGSGSGGSTGGSSGGSTGGSGPPSFGGGGPVL